jgi:hypothetical protein
LAVSKKVQFLEADPKTPLPRKLTFSDPEKSRELARRGEAWGTSESRQMLEHAIENGRGRCPPEADTGAVLKVEATVRLMQHSRAHESPLADKSGSQGH